MKQGKVYLVGAGPSDEGLFTIKGNALLKKADAEAKEADSEDWEDEEAEDDDEWEI